MTRLASHNVKVDLPDPDAARAVRLVLQRSPDILGLQEWGRDRRSVLRKFGTVVMFPRLRRLFANYPDAGYVFVYPLGGQPVGFDASRFEVLHVRRVKLSAKRPGVRPTYGTRVKFRKRGGKTQAVLNVHPVAHHDRPQNALAHLEAVESIREWVESWHGFDRYVMGDMNSRHVALPPLVSCWDGRRDLPTGPHGGAIDHIYGPRGFESVEVIDTPSDHHAVVADTR